MSTCSRAVPHANGSCFDYPLQQTDKMSRLNGSQSYDIERQQQQEIDEEKGMPIKQTTIVTEEPAEAERPEVRPAHRVHYGTAVVDVLIALLPLYFVVFAILAYIRNDTLANSFRNMAIMRMSKLV